MKIEGKNSVLEALRSKYMTVNSLHVVEGDNSEIVRLAKANGVKTQFLPKNVLDKESQTGHCQGYIADVTDFQYCELEDILSASQQHFIVILDDILDPHNFGSIIRVCECAGVDGIVIGRNRQVAVTDTVLRCSAGAASHMRIARVTNINNAIKQLQQSGVWVYCADMDGQEMTTANLTGNIALVIGSEGNGVSKLTKQLCDGVISIKLKGNVNSLNASVACGIVVYEAVRQRG